VPWRGHRHGASVLLVASIIRRKGEKV
jgi:hypothetical protein